MRSEINTDLYGVPNPTIPTNCNREWNGPTNVTLIKVRDDMKSCSVAVVLFHVQRRADNTILNTSRLCEGD